MGRQHIFLATLLVLLTTGSLGATSSDRDVQCLRLDNRIAGLRLKLRTGYTAQQGRIYRQKLAALEAERRLVCR